MISHTIDQNMGVIVEYVKESVEPLVLEKGSKDLPVFLPDFGFRIDYAVPENPLEAVIISALLNLVHRCQEFLQYCNLALYTRKMMQASAIGEVKEFSNLKCLWIRNDKQCSVKGPEPYGMSVVLFHKFCEEIHVS
jgi:hypothetical protein